MTQIPTRTLRDGHTMPQLGFGVWQVPPDEVVAPVATALAAGYRLIDTAAAYRNEKGVGRAIAESGVPRDELFVTTKLWNPDHGYDKTHSAFDDSLGRLGLDWLDLYLIHWPVPSAGLYVEAWKAMIDLVGSGRVRSIGVSNFNPVHVQRLIDETGVVPVVNQVELHPGFAQPEVRAFDAAHDIVTEAWSPLGQGRGLLDDPVLGAIGRGPRAHAGAGGAALEPAVGQRGDPQVGDPRTHPGQPGGLRLRAGRRRDGPAGGHARTPPGTRPRHLRDALTPFIPATQRGPGPIW